MTTATAPHRSPSPAPQASFELLSPQLRDRPEVLAERFGTARPFRHLVLDGFLREDAARALLEQFPPFERGNRMSENGTEGRKSTVEKIRELGPAFVALDDLVRSEHFLGWLSCATSIPDLLYDPWYFGGGTHENLDGQDLDVHVDFNRHPVTGWHRRLNLIVYLNPDWDEGWGGALELHRDPRSEHDEVRIINPVFNRCVIFETTEWSWHGFSPIRLPSSAQGRSRRSVALYFYTRERPVEELAPAHSTIYVDRPLPDRFRAGYRLAEEDVQELRVLLARRDQHIRRLYEERMRASTQEAPAARPRNLLADAAVRVLRPLASRLPAGIREPLRRWWRRR
ncbi:MAG: hypothetical protein KatS3mg126_0965 [Lysobacteraceae bacterium]|nr:MAG: hypothetical protein KatS3mg126_0965 [Xanthomonadaceae bacterium]